MSGQSNSNPDKSSALNSTKQLLDELDVLMQRMLALPVGQESAKPDSGGRPISLLDDLPDKTRIPAEVSAEAEENDTAADLGEDAPAETPRSYVYDSEAAPEDKAVNSYRSDTNKLAAAAPVRQEESLSPPAAPAPACPVSAETLASLTKLGSRLAEEPVLQRSRLLAAGAVRRKRWWLRPLSLTNYAFDVCTYVLGPLGRWLREPVGRKFLGWLGIVLLLAALGLQIVLWVSW